jgi:branched-chain amino acid transport system permease protein
LAVFFISLIILGLVVLFLVTFFFFFSAFPAIVLGGFVSLLGAVLGGLIIGLTQSFSSLLPWEFLGSGFGGVVPYIVMLIVLLIRPYGLFGTEEIRRV